MSLMGIFTFRQFISLCVGLMLLAFAVISIMIGEVTLQFIPFTIMLFLVGGYLSYRGLKGALTRAGPSTRPIQRRPPTQRLCPNCGKPVEVGDKFCPSCGHQM